MIRVIVVDGHPIVRIGITALLENTPDIKLIGEAKSGMKALEYTEVLKPDILLLECRLPDMPGPQVCVEIQKMNIRTRVIGFSDFSDEVYIIRLVDAGAQGYVLKTENPTMLLEAIRAVAREETWFSPKITNLILNRMRNKSENRSLLTPRELEVLQLLSRGYSNIQIARSLMISTATVKNHLSSIFNRLAVNSRTEAINWAWSNDLILK